MQPGTQTGITWNPGTTRVQVSTGTLALSAVTGAHSSASVSYTVANAGTTNCAFQNSTRTLTFNSVGTCQVRATVTRAHYTNWTSDVDIVVVNTPPVVITWTGYGSSSNEVTWGETAPALDTPGLVPAGAVATYSSTGNACTVTGSGVLTMQRAGTCRVTLSASAANREDSAVSVTVTVRPARIVVAGATDIAKWGIYPTVTVGGGSVSAPTIGATTPAGVTKTYTSLSPGVCTVDSTTGALTAVPSQVTNCSVKLVLSANNYRNREFTYGKRVQPGTIAIAGSDIAARWGRYAAVKVGEETAAPAIGNTTPATEGKRYLTYTGAFCSVDSATGVVRGIKVGACRIIIHISAVGYDNLSYIYSISVQPGTIEVAGATESAKWGSYGTVAVGEGAIPPPNIGETTPTSTLLGRAYTLGSNSSGCSVTPEGWVTGTIAGTNNCEVVLTLSKTHYADRQYTYTFSVLSGTQRGIRWNLGTTSVRAGAGTLVLAAVTGFDSSATVSYTVAAAGSTNCAFQGSSGVNARTLTFDTAGTCRVRARVRRTHYGDWTSNVDILVTGISPVGITWTGYGSGSNAAALGQVAPVLDAPTLNPNTASATYTSTGSACSAASDGTLTISGVGFCQVTVTATANGRSSGSATVTVDVGKGALAFSTNLTPSYSDTSLYLRGKLEVEGNIITGDDNGVAVSWYFSAAGSRSGSAQNGICSVDNHAGGADFGTVSADSSARVGDVCEVTVTASAPDYISRSQVISLSVRNPRPVSLTGIIDSSCALFEGGRIKCWGENDYDQLGYGGVGDIGNGNNEMGSNLGWVNLGAGRTVQKVSTSYHTCVVLDDSSIKCWGDNTYGQLGIGSDDSYNSTPTLVNLGAGKSAKTVSAGEEHTCAILNDDSVKCWGDNTSGELGTGDTNEYNAPTTDSVDLGEGKSALVVGAGYNHSCALLNDGSIKCWGSGLSGRLGNGRTNDSSTPVTVSLPAGKSATMLSVGRNHSCAVLNDNSLVCWGDNSFGRLGVGGTGNRSTPGAVNLGSGKTAKAVKAGFYHSCAILNDDSLKCWGDGDSGKLGYEDDTIRYVPAGSGIDLGTGKNAVAVSVGSEHTCALLNDHTVKCWGTNVYGQLGAGPNTDTESDDEIVWGDDSGEMGNTLPVVELL